MVITTPYFYYHFMPEILERFLDCAREYFAYVSITEVTDNAITFSVVDIDEDYLLASLQSICEDLAAEFEVQTNLESNTVLTYTFSYTELTE